MNAAFICRRFIPITAFLVYFFLKSKKTHAIVIFTRELCRPTLVKSSCTVTISSVGATLVIRESPSWTSTRCNLQIQSADCMRSERSFRRNLIGLKRVGWQRLLTESADDSRKKTAVKHRSVHCATLLSGAVNVNYDYLFDDSIVINLRSSRLVSVHASSSLLPYRTNENASTIQCIVYVLARLFIRRQLKSVIGRSQSET